MKIVLKKKDGKYLHLLDSDVGYNDLKKRILPRLNDDLIRETKEQIVLDCLRFMDEEISKQFKSEYFNVVFLMTMMDDLHREFTTQCHPVMARAFINESIRLLLTWIDLKDNLLYGSRDYAAMDQYAAYPSSAGIKTIIQRNDIYQYAGNNWDVYRHAHYPENFEFSSFGDYQKLKELLYKDNDTHDNNFNKFPLKKETSKPQSPLNGHQKQAIKKLIKNLEQEINSCWPFFNTTRKVKKWTALKKLLKASSSTDMNTLIESIENQYPEIRSGFFSKRTATLLDGLKEKKEERATELTCSVN